MTCASCVARIEKGLADVPGVHEVSVNLAMERATLTYDPARVGVEDITKAIEELGYDVPAEKLTLSIGGMTCASCVATIERALSAVPGVVRASVNLGTEKATIEALPSVRVEVLTHTVEAVGYSAVPVSEVAPDREKAACTQKCTSRRWRSSIRSLSSAAFWRREPGGAPWRQSRRSWAWRSP
jgi:Cu+-exporting ATPase